MSKENSIKPFSDNGTESKKSLRKHRRIEKKTNRKKRKIENRQARTDNAESYSQDRKPGADINTIAPAPAPKKRRRRFGDRSDGYKIRSIPVITRLMPYIMAKRSDALNTYADSFDLLNVEPFCRRKIKEGKTNFTVLHIFLAAYVRTVSQRPALNRFVSGQKIFSRNNIEMTMTVKKEMSLDSPDTCIKVIFEPTDTIDEIYEKFNKVVEEATKQADTSFDGLAKGLNLIPGLFLRWTIKLLNFLDYFGMLPKKLLKLSPFHGSMIITSMGSLGIKPIYHHIYDFGNLPIFIAYGAKRSVTMLDRYANVVRKKFIDIKVVTDERICDGYYYASAFKLMKRYFENPEILESAPEKVYEDIR